MTEAEKLELARRILAERDAFWFACFLWDNGYSLQCGEYLLDLEAGNAAADEPPWVYAMGDDVYHSRKLAACAPKELPHRGDCTAVYLDFREAETSAWSLFADRFEDADGYEYAVVDHGSRVTNLPAALIDYDRISGLRYVALDFICPACGGSRLAVQYRRLETHSVSFVKRRGEKYDFCKGKVHIVHPGGEPSWRCEDCGRQYRSLEAAMETAWQNLKRSHAARYRVAGEAE